MNASQSRQQFQHLQQSLISSKKLKWCVGLLGFGLLGTGLGSELRSEDWLRFRGVNGLGIAPESNSVPSEFGETKNLKWRAALPGPGHSCPIIVGNKVFVTCWSGYGTNEEGGDPANLKRHLTCLDKASGKILWDRTVPAALPEDQYFGMFAEHGYASHTPTSDGERVYAFFGKSGVHAFDLDGNAIWQASVGDGLDPRKWGSSCSPILAGDLLIVLASAESQTLFAFNKETGKEVWKKTADGFAGTWGTPVLVDNPDGAKDLVIGVPYEVWAFNPENGKFKWYFSVADSDSYCSSLIADKGIVYSLEGRNGGGFALKAGGTGDVTKTNLLWEKPLRNRIGTPVLVDGKLFYFSGRIARCIDAATGEQIFEARLPQASSSGTQPDANAPRGGRGGRQGGGGGGRGGMGGQDYSSPVVADGKIFYVTRNGDIHVIQVGSDFKSLAVNRLTNDEEDFSASPAVSDGQLFIRSSKHIYCVGQ